MQYGKLALGLVVAAGIGVACSDSGTTAPQIVLETFVANMTGAKERPTPVTSTTTGTGTFVFEQTGEISYSVVVPSTTPLATLPTGLHIHGPADTSQVAGILVGFNGFAQALSGTIAVGTIRGVSATVSLDSLKALIRNRRVYLNLHTATNPGGEIRGQLVLVP